MLILDISLQAASSAIEFEAAEVEALPARSPEKKVAWLNLAERHSRQVLVAPEEQLYSPSKEHLSLYPSEPVPRAPVWDIHVTHLADRKPSKN